MKPFARYITEDLLTLYHGSPKSDLKTLETNENGVLFLTPALWAAEFHAKKEHTKGAIYVVNVEVRNPYVVHPFKYDTLTADKKFIQWVQDEGYDAVLDDKGLAYAVFKPARIKSKSQVS